MSLVYDATGQLTDNYLSETFNIITSKGIIPENGIFFIDDLVVEVSNDGVRWMPLSNGGGYRYGPLVLDESAKLDDTLYSLIIIQDKNWKYARLTAHFLGKMDTDLLTALALSDFDRSDHLAWSTLTSTLEAQSNTNTKPYSGLTEASVVGNGFTAIAEALNKLATPSSDATVAERVNNIEYHLSQLVELFATTGGDIVNINEELESLQISQDQLEDTVNFGNIPNTEFYNGYVYVSDGASVTHRVTHGLDLEFPLVDFWYLTIDGNWHKSNKPVKRLDNDTLEVSYETAKKVIGVIRKPSDKAVSAISTNITSLLTVDHTLPNDYFATSVWVQREGEWYAHINTDVTMASDTRVAVSYPSGGRLHVTLDPYQAADYIHRTGVSSDTLKVAHYMETQYFHLTVYFKDDINGNWTRVPDAVITTRDSVFIEATMPVAGYFLVLGLPVGVAHNQIVEELKQTQVGIYDRQQQILSDLDAAEDIVEKLNVIQTKEFESETDVTSIDCQHDFNQTFVGVQVWQFKEDADIWEEIITKSTPLSKNVIRVYVQDAAKLHVVVRRNS